MLQSLESMREQLRYWEEECGAARKAGDKQRIALCERFIAQTKHVISALEGALARERQSSTADEAS